MKQLKMWNDNDILKKDVKSCDNHDLGPVKELDSNLIVSEKGGRRYQIPRDSIATFDGDKVWLRATEAEVMMGMYPFLQEDENKLEERRLDTIETAPPAPPSLSSVP